jgi:putative transposase
MARLPRLSVAGELHYVIQRGHNRQLVFQDDADRTSYLAALRDAAREHGLAVHAYALLDNEVRLLATPERADSLSKAMQALGRRYVAGFNRRHGRSGTLWEGRFRAAILESECYFISALCLVDQAPLQPTTVHPADAAVEYQWSSAAHHLGRRRDPLVQDHRLYWALGNTPFDRELAYRRLLEQGPGPSDSAALANAADKSWALGSAAFLAHLSERTARPLAARKRGRSRKSSTIVPSPFNSTSNSEAS